ncbi:MAG TPA: MFS transporter [Terracidiphilus sp.]|nr:MFS transporter [Terracidiphilus sp.]
MQPLYRKISRRLVPFLILLYLVAFLDRVNIGFAALTMNRDLQIDASLFGLAAGMFFLGYFLFEVPSNLILLRVGARRWITVLMVAWGCVSVATALAPNPTTYIALRFLLGLAEAGFYPGVILYLTFWLPPAVRSSIMAMFVAAIPLSSLVGSPISAQILLLDNLLGLRGWQWLFVLEGAPAILLGFLVLLLLPNGPSDVRWLSPLEKQTLQRDLRDASPAQSAKKHSFLDMFTAEPAVYGWSLAYFLLMLGLYGLGFWIPTVLASHGLGIRALGWATALPYLVAIAAMLLWSHRSDRRGERRFHLAAAYVAAGAGFLVAAFATHASMAVAGFTLAAVGVLSAMPVFWSASTVELAGPLVAAHIAVINSIGNLGGFFGPVIMGWLRHVTHHYIAGLAVIACCLAAGAFVTARLCRPAAAAATS